MPLPPHMVEPSLPPHERITHEDLAELINAKFDRLFREIEEIKSRLG